MMEPFSPGFFRQLQQLKIRTRRRYLGSRQGAHSSRRRGHGLEFSDFKAYTPGDDFRHIDWSVYGRTDRLYVRQFREEQDLSVILLLDTSASMGHPIGERKFEMARGLALAMGHIALSDGDTVTFSLLGKRNSPKFTGPRALGAAMKELSQVKPEGNFELLSEVRAAIANQRLPGKCFLISDFLVELEEQYQVLDFLRSKNYDITVFQVLAPSELNLSIEEGDVAVDAETGEKLEIALDAATQKSYAKKIADHIYGLEEYCQRAGIAHVLVPSDEEVSYIVLNRLPELGVLK